MRRNLKDSVNISHTEPRCSSHWTKNSGGVHGRQKKTRTETKGWGMMKLCMAQKGQVLCNSELENMSKVFWWLLGTRKRKISGHTATLQICFWISISGSGLNHYDLWKYKYMKGSWWLLRRKMDCKSLISFQGKNTLNFCAKIWGELYCLSPNSVLAISVKAL